MAHTPTITDEELQFRKKARRRLIGAIVLVTLMVALLPMVLDDKPRPVNPDIVITIPSRDGAGDFASRIQPLPADKPAEAAAEPAPQPVAEAAPAAAVPVAPAQPTVETALPQPAAPVTAAPAKVEPVGAKPKAEPAKAEAPRPEAGKGGWLLRMGAFSDRANAEKRLAELKARKFRAYAETVKTPSGERTRVRAGPYDTQEEAERLLAKLRALGINGDVVARDADR